MRRKGLKLKRIIILIFCLCLVGVLSIPVVDFHVSKTGSRYICEMEKVQKADAIIIFGAYVSGGTVSKMLADRLNYGYELYKKGLAPKILVSGDHGRLDYDEVNAMRQFLQLKGVPRSDIFMDHAGFNTYESIYRARDVFMIKKAILVTQEYHLVRALYIAKKLGVEAQGVSSDTMVYPNMDYYRKREYGARYKAFLQAGIFKPEPTFLGDTIPIWKSGEMTDDGK